MVKRLPTMWETWVQSLGWEDLLEKEMATHSSILAQKIPWTEEPGVHGVAESWTRLSGFTHSLMEKREKHRALGEHGDLTFGLTCSHQLAGLQGIYGAQFTYNTLVFLMKKKSAKLRQ